LAGATAVNFFSCFPFTQVISETFLADFFDFEDVVAALEGWDEAADFAGSAWVFTAGRSVIFTVGAEKVNPKARISTLSVSATYLVELVACFEEPSA
jgi:hypothetical protein